MLNEELILTASVVHVETPARNHCHPVGRFKPQVSGGHTEASALYLRVTIF